MQQFGMSVLVPMVAYKHCCINEVPFLPQIEATMHITSNLLFDEAEKVQLEEDHLKEVLKMLDACIVFKDNMKSLWEKAVSHQDTIKLREITFINNLIEKMVKNHQSILEDKEKYYLNVQRKQTADRAASAAKVATSLAASSSACVIDLQGSIEESDAVINSQVIVSPEKDEHINSSYHEAE